MIKWNGSESFLWDFAITNTVCDRILMTVNFNFVATLKTTWNGRKNGVKETEKVMCENRRESKLIHHGWYSAFRVCLNQFYNKFLRIDIREHFNLEKLKKWYNFFCFKLEVDFLKRIQLVGWHFTSAMKVQTEIKKAFTYNFAKKLFNIETARIFRNIFSNKTLVTYLVTACVCALSRKKSNKNSLVKRMRESERKEYILCIIMQH